jgi:hypothetical protein
MDELFVELGHDLGILQDDLRHECSRLQVTAALEFEQVALRADDWPSSQPFEQASRG